MRHARSLGFDALETRRLLSRTHLGVHAEVASVPLVLNGTLTVDDKAAAATQNNDGSTTTSTPVSGTLGTLGKVRGTWDKNVDAYGDILEPDTMQLHDTKGAFTVVFNSQDLGKAHPDARGAVYPPLSERARGGMGVFARETQTGSLVMVTNAARSDVETLTLSTPAS